MGSGLFTPDERGIGGAMEIAQGYRHFFASRATPCTRSAAAPSAQAPTAQQLSFQRAMKHATSDTTSQDHMVRLQHLCRRVAQHAAAGAGASQQQRHNQQHEQQRRRPNSAALGLCPWLPRAELQPAPTAKGLPRRPSTAPERLSSTGSGSNAQGANGTRDWQQLKAAAHPAPQPPVQPVQLPASRYYLGPNLLPSVQHRLYKAALMSDILQRQLFKAADIRQLCVQFVEAAPLEQRSTARQVSCEVLSELNIQPCGELR